MKHPLALVWLLLSLHTLAAAQSVPLEPLPATTAIVVAPGRAPRRAPPSPFAICGDPIILQTLSFESSSDSDLVYLMHRREGGWSSLLTLPGTDGLTRQPVGIPVATWPKLTQPSAERGISHLIACWVAEKDHTRLTRHTAQIARLASSAIQQRYALDLVRRTLKDPYQHLCALYIISTQHPRYVFQRHFGTLIAPTPAAAQTPDDDISYHSSQIRSAIIEMLCVNTDATNLQEYWAWMQKATAPGLKAQILGQLLSCKILREGETTGIETHLRPHRAELLALVRSDHDILSHTAYLGLCRLHPALQPVCFQDYLARRNDLLSTIPP